MEAIKLSGWVGEDKKLVLELPAETPVGEVEVVVIPRNGETQPIKLVNGMGQLEAWVERREQLRKKLLADHLSRRLCYAPQGYVPLSDEARMALVKLPEGARLTDTLIDEDRGAY
jgi:hypothetical protein